MMIYIIISVVATALIVFLIMHQSKGKQKAMLEKEYMSKQAEDANRLKASFDEQLQTLTNEKVEAEKQLAVTLAELEQSTRHNEKMREELEKQFQQRLNLMREEMKSMAEQMLKQTRSELNNADRERLDALIAPLKERMETFSKAVNDNNRDNATHKTEIKTAFEAAMKQLHEEQERTVKELKEQTERIGQGAEHLTKALKGDSKMQGDWGEMILETTLENCGLKKNEQFFLQENIKDKEGNNLRPDAIVVFPNEERVIIDSKVSLTAYLESLKTEEETERERLLKEHVASVKRHIDELTDKNYDKYVAGSIGYVLMFIPYESGYAAAIKTEPSLLQYAYRKKIIIISPANLLMTLQLTHTMWQNYRMNKNVEEIMRQSSDLYDKFVGFAETFIKIEKDIENIRKHYDEAHGQLSEGKGNIVRRFENMKQLGVNPKKEVPPKLSQQE